MSDAQTPAVNPKTAEPKLPSASVTVLNDVAATVSKSKLRRRHVWLIMSFLFCVMLPTAVSVFYLYQIAEDQFSSRVSFSIRSEQSQSPLDALSSLGQLSTGSSSDASILNEYLRSQKLVEDILENIDLKAVYSKPDFDPVFAFNPDKPLEDLVDYFHNINNVTFDASNGLLDVEAFAFTPDDAQMIAAAIMNASINLVERLSSIAQEDTTKNAKFELERARERLEQARKTLGELRGREQTIDPRSDLESQTGVLTALQSQLATALIEYDLLLSSTLEADPRLSTVKRKIEAIEHRIEAERSKIGQIALNGGSSLATVIGNFESLMADREFAERAYLAAAATYDASLAEARRKSKYLAAHIPPTLAQSSQYPNKPLLALALFGICLLIWSVAMLTVYAMLDRR